MALHKVIAIVPVSRAKQFYADGWHADGRSNQHTVTLAMICETRQKAERVGQSTSLVYSIEKVES